MRQRDCSRGFVLITTLFMMSVLLALLGAYFVTTRIELATTRASHESTAGFFAAEAGLNIRAEEIRQTFVGYNLPSGTSPITPDPCVGGNQGSDDFACDEFAFSGHEATTYVVDETGGVPIITTIPPGELYQNLNAQEYRYTVNSTARGPAGNVESILELRFKSRLVPLFQFVAFYDKDLEILPGPVMNLNGPVHTNGDLYLNTDAGSTGLTINGQISTADDLYRGRKNTNVCNSTQVRIYNPSAPVALVPACATRVTIQPNQITGYNGMIQMDVDELVVPPPETFDPVAGSLYWDRADLRLVLNLDGAGNPITTNSVTGVEVRNLNDTVDTTMTNNIHNTTSCPSGQIAGRVIGNTYTFYSQREAKRMRFLEVDMRNLLNCLHNTDWFGQGRLSRYNSEGGLVFHITVKGPESNNAANRYGVRLRNSDDISYYQVSGKQKGLTIVSDQAAYTQGHYNRTNKIGAAIMADSYNPLSQGWNYANETGASIPWASRNATNTTINAALLAGTDTTGGAAGEGEVGQGGAYNGGLENYPRFMENWTGDTLTYRGSFVSLERPRHVAGTWFYGNPVYTAPNRNWDYDTSFNDASNLPPLSPRFVYLRQELFVRDYEQE